MPSSQPILCHLQHHSSKASILLHSAFFMVQLSHPNMKSESESHSVVSDSLQPHGLHSPWNSPGQNSGVGSPCHSPGDLLNPGIEPMSPTLQAVSLPAEPPGKPKILGWIAYPFSRGSSQPRNRTRVSCIAGGFFTN